MQVKLALWPGDDWPGAVEGQVASTVVGSGQRTKSRHPEQTSTGIANQAVVKLLCEARIPSARTLTRSFVRAAPPAAGMEAKYWEGMRLTRAPDEPAVGTVTAAGTLHGWREAPS